MSRKVKRVEGVLVYVKEDRRRVKGDACEKDC